MTLKTFFKALFLFLVLVVGLIAGLSIGIKTYPNEVFEKTANGSYQSMNGWAKWLHLRKVVGADYREIVRPNQDTIYSSAFVDLSEGPYLLRIPPIDGNYSFTVYGDNTDVIGSVTSRTHGTGKPQSLLIASPSESLDASDIQTLRTSSDKVWILGRFWIEKDSDYPVFHQIQDALDLAPYSQ